MAGHSLWLVEISFFPAQSKNAPSGNVLVASANTDNILRYNLADRSYLDIFATTAPECAVDMTLQTTEASDSIPPPETVMILGQRSTLV
jgi:hypothetical protein